MSYTLSQRLKAKTLKKGHCWIWGGYVNPEGYGEVYVRKSEGGTKRGSTLAHVASYQTFTGQIPKGLQIDHLCRKRACINPDHLEAVTAKENVRRSASPAAINSARTTCKHGHEFRDEQPLRLRIKGWRMCHECHRLRSARNREVITI